MIQTDSAPDAVTLDDQLAPSTHTPAHPTLSKEQINPVFVAALATLVLTEEDPTRRPGFETLRLSIRQAGGVKVPIFIGPCRTDGLFPVLDGNTRVAAARLEGFTEVPAILVEEELDEIGLIEFGALHNGVRRVMSPEEWAIKAERLIALLNCSQEEAARRLDRSPASISRYLTTLLLPEKHAERARLLAGSVRSLLAGIKDATHQDQAVEYASTPGPDKKLPSRLMVELQIKKIRGSIGPGRPAKKFVEIKFPASSPVASIVFRGGSDPKNVLKELRSIANLTETNAGYGFDAVVAILKGRKPTDPPAPTA